jgi:hypothetical protein
MESESTQEPVNLSAIAQQFRAKLRAALGDSAKDLTAHIKAGQEGFDGFRLDLGVILAREALAAAVWLDEEFDWTDGWGDRSTGVVLDGFKEAIRAGLKKNGGRA